MLLIDDKELERGLGDPERSIESRAEEWEELCHEPPKSESRMLRGNQRWTAGGGVRRMTCKRINIAIGLLVW